MTVNNPYNVWDTHKLLGVFRDTKPVYQYWLPLFANQINSDEEYIDFEKLPLQGRKLMSFVLPMGRGKSVYDDSVTVTRFKPAYAKSEDRIDPLMPLTKRAGIDASILQPNALTPMQRRDLIRAAMIASHRAAYERRLDWMAAQAVINGTITISGDNYPTTVLDFGRAAGQTQTLGGGAHWGDSGVSIVDHVQSVIDTMVNAAFGGMPTKMTMGSAAWGVFRKDAEVLEHMDLFKRGNAIDVERGLVPGEKIFKAGEMLVGGASGASLEIFVNNDTYTDPTSGAQTRFIGTKEVVFTSTADAIQGYRCFGRIIDPDAQYQALDYFPKNWTDREGDVLVEYLTTKTAPLMVPINPNATFKSTVLA
jgi:hypothetical protein